MIVRGLQQWPRHFIASPQPICCEALDLVHQHIAWPEVLTRLGRSYGEKQFLEAGGVFWVDPLV